MDTTNTLPKEYEAIFARYPALSREEEVSLATRAQKGDKGARDKLIRHHLSYAVTYALRMRRGPGVRLEDVIQEGTIGLAVAVDKYDPESGFRFGTYSLWWIRAYIGKYLAQARSVVRPRASTIAQYDFSLDTPLEGEDGDDGGLTHGDCIADEATSPEVAYGLEERRMKVRIALAKVRGRLGEVAWDILHSRTISDEPEILETLGERHGFSRERARQIEQQTNVFLKRYLPGALMDASVIAANSDEKLVAALRAYDPDAAGRSRNRAAPRRLLPGSDRAGDSSSTAPQGGVTTQSSVASGKAHGGGGDPRTGGGCDLMKQAAPGSFIRWDEESTAMSISANRCACGGEIRRYNGKLHTKCYTCRRGGQKAIVVNVARKATGEPARNALKQIAPALARTDEFTKKSDREIAELVTRAIEELKSRRELITKRAANLDTFLSRVTAIQAVREAAVA